MSRVRTVRRRVASRDGEDTCAKALTGENIRVERALTGQPAATFAMMGRYIRRGRHA